MPSVEDPQFAQKQRKYAAKHSRKKFAEASDVGEIPACKHPHQRRLCRNDLHLFAQWYFPESAGLAPYGEGHRKALQRMQDAILHGGRILNCLPRGFAKSTLSEIALLWAVLYGHRRYGVIFAASADEAGESIASLKSELQENERLFADFPEVCIPVRALEGRSQRCQTQTHCGKLTGIRWTSDTVVLPTIPGGPSSGGILRAKGYMASSRGLRYKRSDGQQARPDLAVIDDPQTDESAEKPGQIDKRLRILQRSILRSGGHGRALTAIMNGTVICDGDMPDQLADHKKHPEWQAIRVKMMEAMPDAIETHWLNEYRRLRHDYDPEVDGDQQRAHWAATEYYVANREAMDAGAMPSWHHIPLEEDEVSATQHAMNILIDDGEDVFSAECQNEPRRLSQPGVALVDREEVARRLTGHDRRVVPETASMLVAHCDVHDAILYYTVVGICSDFTGFVVDYGCYPEQSQSYFRMHSLKATLSTVTGSKSSEDAIATGISRVINDLCGRVWSTPSGELLPVSKVLIDTGYKPDEVARGVRLSDHASACWGARGIGIGPVEKPMPEYDVSPKRVSLAGPNPAAPRWFAPRTTSSGFREIRFDANYWKSVVAARLIQPVSSAGAWSLWGNERIDHGPYIEHLASEEPVSVKAKGRTVNVWKTRPNHENHWWDTLVGCSVAASLLGVQVPGAQNVIKQQPRRKRRRRKIEVIA